MCKKNIDLQFTSQYIYKYIYTSFLNSKVSMTNEVIALVILKMFLSYYCMYIFYKKEKNFIHLYLFVGFRILFIMSVKGMADIISIPNSFDSNLFSSSSGRSELFSLISYVSSKV